MANEHLTDPRKLFHPDEYPKQEQDTPAVEQGMSPKPDCGEKSYEGSGKLKGRKALVTGGDSGIGRAAAIAYAREGADVAVQFFPGEEKDAEEVKGYIEDAGQKALLLAYDLREDEAATEIIKKTVEEFGGVDILVLNAAQQIAHENLQDFTVKQIEDTFKVNVISQMESVLAAEKHLEPGSAIITTTSVQAYGPSIGMLDYAATNAAISNMTVNLAQYFTPKGIRVNGVAPGPIWTPLQLDSGQPKNEESIPEFGQSAPLGRSGQPVELAPVYVLLASDQGSYISGQIYGVTGGSPI